MKTWHIVAIIAGVLLTWALVTLGSFAYFGGDAAKSGQFGDTAGLVNSLFSGLAFTALVITVLLQQHELRLQREELALQRREMAASRQVLEQQAETQNNQFLASIGSIRVASIKAEMDLALMKLDAQFETPFVINKKLTDCVARIEEVSDGLVAIARNAGAKSKAAQEV